MNRLNSTLTVATVTLATLTGCGPKFTAEPGVDGYQVSGPGQKVPVEAYLYDVRIRRDGKPTSLRLELFQTDTLVAMGGRGYLGKGALKGLLTADSIEVYFPTRREYLHEAVRDLLFTSSCTHSIPQLDFPALMKSLPQEQGFGTGLMVERDDSDNKRPRFILTWTDCAWRMELSYNQRKTGWRLNQIRFDDGDKLSFTAKRRAYKASTKVKRKKFELYVEPGYTRLTL
jgi:hypothetical protein